VTRLCLVAAAIMLVAGVQRNTDDVKIYASKKFVRWNHPTAGYSIEHPVDWKPHPQAARTNIGSDDGLVAGERGFRTVYGVIIAVVDDPLAASSDRSLEASSRAIIETILKRNAHLSIKSPLAAETRLGGSPAFRAVAGGTSPVTGDAERAEVICRPYDASRLLYVIFACPEARCGELTATFQQMRNSLQVAPVPK
jgi:hypothetical protein